MTALSKPVTLAPNVTAEKSYHLKEVQWPIELVDSWSFPCSEGRGPANIWPNAFLYQGMMKKAPEGWRLFYFPDINVMGHIIDSSDHSNEGVVFYMPESNLVVCRFGDTTSSPIPRNQVTSWFARLNDDGLLNEKQLDIWVNRQSDHCFPFGEEISMGHV
mgnify:CR=1 FL=1